MKKKTVKSLSLAKRSISQLNVDYQIKGGNSGGGTGTAQCCGGTHTLTTCPRVSIRGGICTKTKGECDK
jgi:hypothetical protein